MCVFGYVCLSTAAIGGSHQYPGSMVHLVACQTFFKTTSLPYDEEDVIKTDRLNRYERTFIRNRRTGIK